MRPTFSYAATNDGTATLVHAGAIDLHFLSVDNEDDEPRYVQVFDAKSTGEVTLGETPPEHSFRVSSSPREIRPPSPFRFTNGIVMAVTEERDGSTPVTNPANVNARLG